MLDQYRRLKAEHPGTILFFRMGDFYETFGEDALIASRVLGITLTSRDKKKEGSLPLAGVPHHAVDGYLRTLVNEGHSVAIADQMEPAAEARGLVDRQIVEVLTPGTITRDGILNAVESNYIVALYPDGDRVGVSVAEVSTGEFRVGEVAKDEMPALLLEYPSRELLIPAGTAADGAPPWGAAARTTRWDAARFDARAGRQSLERRFGVLSLQSYGLGDPGLGFGAAGALLDYLRSLKKSDLPQIGNVQPLREGAPLVVDEVTLRNLEVLESQAGPEHRLLRIPDLAKVLRTHAGAVTREWLESIPDLSTLASELRKALADELPMISTQGGIIREGYDKALDSLRRDAQDARSLVLELETRERARTGIQNLKVGFNRVFGYYLEVTKSQLQRVPADYVRRQTLTGGERYVTPDLTRMEERIEAASVESKRIETEHFQRLRELATREVPAIQAAARALAAIDLHLALGDCASRERWIRPTLEETKALHLVASRHPMVERSLPPGAFQPNDVALDADREQIWLITGPNMAGKSTFLRQVGLSVYLAHIGSFVPCEKATIGLADRIFTRVGASDQIARGASTFFVEMQETATILRQATDRSLVLLDEIGRGTSTYDGLSLAWAVTESLHEGPGARPRTLFATHYHELTDLESTLPRLRNRNVRVSETDGRIVFLHAIAPGRADRSYGIHVAKLAGVPEPVLHRAREILHELESGERPPVRGSSDGGAAPAGMPPGFLAALAGELSRLSVESMTPLDALNELARLRDRAQESREH